MDSAQLDHDVEALKSVSSRRLVLAGLAGLTALRPTTVILGADQKKRRKRRQRRRKQAATTGILNVAVAVHNLQATPVSVRKWIWSDKRSNQRGYWKEDDWQEIPAKPATGPEAFVDVSGQDAEVVAELSNGYVIHAANPLLGFPRVTIWSGKWSSDGIDRNASPKELLDTGLEVNEKQAIAGFQVQRVPDSLSNKWIKVSLV